MLIESAFFTFPQMELKKELIVLRVLIMLLLQPKPWPQNVVVVTGEHDYVTDGLRVIVVSNGDAILKVITAAGCALTATLAAFVSLVDPNDITQVMKSSAFALSVFGIAAELAVKQPTVKGPGSARMHMLDAYGSINMETLQEMAKFS